MTIAWGLITAQRYSEICAQGIHLHVFVNGIDITERGALIHRADDASGQVECWRTDKLGHIAKPWQTHIIRGSVEFKEVSHDGPCSLKLRQIKQTIQ